MRSTFLYNIKQREFLRSQGLKEGDQVCIVREAFSGEEGWDNDWNEMMSPYIGQTLTIQEIYNDGVGIRMKENQFLYPYFCLEAANPNRFKIWEDFD